MAKEISNIYHYRTKLALTWTNILNAPFFALYSMLPFILFKDLHATAWQITLLIALKPAVSLFSIYWSSYVNQRSDRLVANIIWAGVLGHLPFFFTPWLKEAWFLVGFSAIYMLLSRGMIPAWTEILKLNISGENRQKVFARSSTFWYVGNAIFPFLFGWVLDDYFQAWRWLFPITAFISLSAIVLQVRIPIAISSFSPIKRSQKFLYHMISPWKKIWKLSKSRTDFMRFQWGFMILGGSGLMIIQPALPQFFMDTLDLSYVELATALTLCKGIGFALTSRSWAHWMSKVNIFRFCSMVTLLACFYSLLLLGAKWHHYLIYFSYIVYGVMQAGSELGWRLSGPIFSQEEDSSLFSSANVLLVGLRGCVAPFIGSFLAYSVSPFLVMVLGFFLCIFATIQLSYQSRRQVIFAST